MASGCEQPVFPADYAASYREVRGCRRSGDHDLNYVRILADPAAHAPYAERAVPFPERSVVLKVEYSDPACTDVTGFTAMRKESAGYAPSGGDWFWQKVGADRRVLESGQLVRCSGCHQACGQPPDGYDWTCAVP